jgi:hypothetical protein
MQPIPRFSLIKEYSQKEMEIGTIERGARRRLDPSGGAFFRRRARIA